MSETLLGLTFNLMMEDLRGLWLEIDGCGDIGREGGCEAEVADVTCFFLCFFRLDSFPLVSEAERFGDPGRLR